MPIVHIVNACPLVDSFRAQQLRGMFDLPASAAIQEKFDVEVPGLAEPWQIGLIVGPSGSGKTTLARQLFPDKINMNRTWPAHQSILDGFPAGLGTREIVGLLSSVGFSSPRSWLRPFATLSTGEQFRVNLAAALAESTDLAVVDEFTSVVDRTVAKVGSIAVARAIRQQHPARRLIAISCHYDIAEWLEPDWVLDMADRSLSRRRLRRNPIALHIVRVHSSAWKLFERHHYLNSRLHPSAQCFVAMVANQPAAFTAALPFPHPIRPGWREHRTVCLPDYQGVGIGNALSEFVASLYVTRGTPYTSVTSHPAMLRHRSRSPDWRMIRAPSRLGRQSQWASSARRITASFEYRGTPRFVEAAGFGIL